MVAFGHMTAFWTDQRCGETASIQKQDGLFTALQAQVNRLKQLRRERIGMPGLGGLNAHINNAHMRHSTIIRATGELGESVLPALDIGP